VGPQTIVSLQAENVKRLNAVLIEPTGNLVIIGGDNGEGKTSLLDSMMYGLGGKVVVCDKPVREGAEYAAIRVELTDIIVTKIIRPDGTAVLRVTGKDGGKYASPQNTLDNLFSGLTFDPLAFAKMETPKRRQMLQKLVGLDFSALDRKKATLIEQRAAVGQIGERLKGQLAALICHADAPADEVKIFELSTQISEAENVNRDLAGKRLRLAQLNTTIAELEAKLEEAKKQRVAVEKELQGKVDVDVAGMRTRLQEAEAINRKVRDNKQHASVSAEIEARRLEWQGLQDAIKAIEDDKQKQLAAAKFPIDGLSINEQTVTFGGIPFEQLSAAETMRISVGMGFALNPDLRVLLLRDASLLDKKSLALIAGMAAERKGQVWLERVGNADENAIIIEDGYVKGATKPKPIMDKIKDAEIKVPPAQKPAPVEKPPAAAATSTTPLLDTNGDGPKPPPRSFGRPGARRG
jgi:hypothetical protein